jgi:pyridoxamine 5'-phosphate oxidase
MMNVNNKVPLKIPFEIFANWLNRAKERPDIVEPTAMCLATIGDNSQPSARMVLLKKFDENGFSFFTNLTSRKGRELANHQNAALCFYWMPLGLQVRIEGRVHEVSAKEADDYFASRRRDSQIGAWASKQSQIMQDWQEFEDRIAQIKEDFTDQEIPRPPFWSGFMVVPESIEFWQEGEFRIHKREVYVRDKDDRNFWLWSKLYP